MSPTPSAQAVGGLPGKDPGGGTKRIELDNIDNFKFIAKAAKALGDRTRLLIFREIVDRGSMNMSEV